MKLKSTLKQYTMVIALVIVFIFFTVLTGGRLILAQNISNLLLQNAYVMVMACGMLLCILTGGNVDLSVEQPYVSPLRWQQQHCSPANHRLLRS